MATLRVAELETVFTANTTPLEKAAVKVETRKKDLEKKPATLTISADGQKAIDQLLAVEAGAKKLVSKETALQINADVTKAEAKVGDITRDLEVLRRMDTSPQVTADIAKAEANLKTAQARLKAVDGQRAEMVVDVNDGAAKKKLADVANYAGEAGEKGGKEAGEGLADGIVAALVTIPIAGAVIGAGVAIGKALIGGIRDGLQVEVRSDLLTAQTGLDPLTVGKIARVAGEAYADNFGESIASNMDTARNAIQAGLLDPKATGRDSQQVIEQLDGVATILGEDIPRVARSAAQLLKNGLAKNAGEAFDLIVKGQQAGLNVSEDWLDTLDEYGTQWRKLGITGPQAAGLIAQGVRAGARDTDIASDALKEFSIRSIDGSKLTAESFAGIGLSAKKMAEDIAKGGPTAAAALELTLDKLRQVKDPAERAQLAVGLFGTQAEDMGEALYALDLSTAVEQLGNVEGAAKTAVAALGDNAASSIESAQRNIEVAADGIKGALATAFGPQIEGFATFVSENREQVIGFLLDIANGAFDAGRAVVNAAADGTEAFGDFVGTTGPQVLDFIQAILEGIDKLPFVDLGDAVDDFKDMKAAANESFASFDAGSEKAARSIRTNLIENGIDPAQKRLNDVAIPLVAQAAVHDASMRLAKDIDGIGYAADGSKLALDTTTASVNTMSEAGGALDKQLRSTVAALDEQTQKAIDAGTSQEELNAQYAEGRQKLVDQLVAMGYTTEAAGQLADAYGAIPGKVDTVVTASTDAAQAAVDRYVELNTNRKIPIILDPHGGQSNGVGFSSKMQAAGGVLERMAAGGLRSMKPVAQVVPPNTWRVVGDRLDVDESYIPLDGSARSDAIFDETARRMGRTAPMAVGTVAVAAPATTHAAAAAQSTRVSLAGMRVVVRVGNDDLEGYIEQVAAPSVSKRQQQRGA